MAAVRGSSETMHDDEHYRGGDDDEIVEYHAHVSTMIPGILLVSKNESGPIPDDDVIQSVRNRLNKWLFFLGKYGPAIQQGLRSAIGLFYWRLNNYDDALRCFVQIVDEHPGNINALACLSKIYKFARNDEKSREYSDTIEQLMADDEDKVTLAQAQCMLDEGIGLAVQTTDKGSDTEATKLMDTSNRYLKEALRLFENTKSSTQDEVISCSYFIGLNLYRAHNIQKGTYSSWEDLIFHNAVWLECLKHFYRVAAAGEGRGYLKFHSWIHLGSLLGGLSEEDRNRTKRFIIAETGDFPKKCLSDFYQCFEEAARFIDDDIKHVYLVFLSQTLLNNISPNKENFPVIEKVLLKVIALLQESIDLCPNLEINWPAYVEKARAYFIMYEAQKYAYQREKNAEMRRILHPGHATAADDDSGPISTPDKSILLKAEYDLKECVHRNATNCQYDLVRVYFNLGIGYDLQDRLTNQPYIDQALGLIEATLRSGNVSSFTTMKCLEGRCYGLLGKYRHGLECFKRAVRSERVGSVNQHHARLFVASLLHVYVDSKASDFDKYVVQEFAWWMGVFLVVYDTMCLGSVLHQVIDVDVTSRPLLEAMKSIFVKLRQTRVPLQVYEVVHTFYSTRKWTPSKNAQSFLNRLKDFTERPQKPERVRSGRRQESTKTHDLPAVKKSKRTSLDFDYAIIYSGSAKDLNWVKFEAIPFLEICHGLKGHVDARDQIHNQTPAQNLQTAIENCHKILIMISQDFLDSNCVPRGCDTSPIGAIAAIERESDVLLLLKNDCMVPQEFCTNGIENAVDCNDMTSIVAFINAK